MHILSSLILNFPVIWDEKVDIQKAHESLTLQAVCGLLVLLIAPFYTHMRKNSPQQPLRPAVLLAGRSRTDEQTHPAPVPPAGDERESRGTSPSGAVRAGPPAAQARGAGAAPLPPSAQDRPPRRRGVQGQRPAAIRDKP